LLTVFFSTLREPFNDETEEQPKLEDITYDFNQMALIYLDNYT